MRASQLLYSPQFAGVKASGENCCTTVDLTLRVRKFPHAEREVYDLLPLA